MTMPVIGEIRMFSCDFMSDGWVECNGQLLDPQEYHFLYSLLGTSYGGDGTATFGVPDLRGRAPMHGSETIRIGTMDGMERVTLTTAQVPAHSHPMLASSQAASTQRPAQQALAAASVYADPANLKPFAAGALSSTGFVAHDNMQPSLTVKFCIATQGVFPNREEVDADQFIGEIRIFAFDFEPGGWASCDGRRMPIASNTPLFKILGPDFGGDGRAFFNLPSLQARLPMGVGAGPGLTPRLNGEPVGTDTVTLDHSQMPKHNHSVTAQDALGSQSSPENAVLAQGGKPDGRDTVPLHTYAPLPPDKLMHGQTISLAGGGQAHENRQPHLVLNICIALTGVYPY